MRLQEHISKIRMFKRHWIACSKYDNCSKLDYQQCWGGEGVGVGNIRPSNEHENHYDESKIFIRALKVVRKVAMVSLWIG